jgi:hypothetical protein
MKSSPRDNIYRPIGVPTIETRKQKFDKLNRAITERLELSSSGAYVAASENSTKAIITRSHSGICKVMRYSFALS